MAGCILDTINAAEVENKSRDFATETEIERFIEECVEYIDLKLKATAK